MIPADVNGDGVEDLVVVVAYTDWGEIATMEETRYDGIEGMVEVMNVVSALIDHRELSVYPGLKAEIGYGQPSPALALDTSIHAIATGHPALPLVAITDDGISAVRFDSAHGSTPLSLDPLIQQPNLFTDGGEFYSDLEFLVDLDGDAVPDLLLPTAGSWTAFLGTASGFDPTPKRVPPPPGPAGADGDEEDPAPRPRRLPTVRDLNGDGLPELILISSEGAGGAVVYRNLGGLLFDTPVDYGEATQTDRDDEPNHEFVYVGSLRESEPAVAVTRTEVERWKNPTGRQEIEQAKKPLNEYALHALDSALRISDRTAQFEATGYTFEGTESEDETDGPQMRLSGGFQDLDGDGRQDLVSFSLDFSILPLMTRMLVSKNIKLTMNFHVWCQQPDATFREVESLELSGKFKINRRSSTLRHRHLSQFAGDFNADGRADFVQLGRGKRVTIHHGRPGCEYPSTADGAIHLERELRHLGFVRILDLNADGRSDLYVVHPLEKPKKNRSAPVRVDLYFSDS